MAYKDALGRQISVGDTVYMESFYRKFGYGIVQELITNRRFDGVDEIIINLIQVKSDLDKWEGHGYPPDTKWYRKPHKCFKVNAVTKDV